MVVGLRLAPELEVGMGAALKVPDLVRDTGGFNTMAAALEALFSQEELGTYLIELGVIEVSVSLNFGDVSPVVKLGNSEAEGVEGQRRAIEKEEEPGGHSLDWSVEVVGGVCIELCDVQYLIWSSPASSSTWPSSR